MQDFTRRTLIQGGTALAATGALTGSALFDFAKAWAQASPWKAEKGAKLTVMRWKRFVPAEDDAFNAMVAAFKTATGPPIKKAGDVLRQGDVILVVNVASFCGNTPQYASLQKINEKYKEKGFIVLGFPANEFGKQEPGSNEQIKEFCTGT